MKLIESPKCSQPFTAKRNILKIKAVIGFTLVYAVFWLTNIYSTRFFLSLTVIDFTICLSMYIEITNSELGQFMKAILFGLIPLSLFISIPSYFFFAVYAHFICLMFGFSEVNWNKMPYLFFSNVVGWIFGFTYLKYRISSNDPEMMAVEALFTKNNLLAYQIILGFLINYFVVCVITINKFLEDERQREYENELLQLNNELEITNAKLKNSNKELQDALQEKENFILRFSHEIRNPLNSLLGNVELCYEQTADNKELNTMLHDAKVSGEILLQLLNNVLDTAKVSAGRLEVSLSTQNIREFLERSWVICAEIIRKKRLYGCLSVNVNVPEFLEFDHHRLMQILLNTVSNAAKFTEYGHVRMYVDYIRGSEIKSEDMIPKYVSAYRDDIDICSGIFGQEEITEKPQSIFEHLTLSNKRFRLDRDVFVRHYTSGVEIPALKDYLRDEKELEISSSGQKQSGSYYAEGTKTQKFPDVPPTEDGFLRFEILDSGCGMLKKDIDAAFGKFKQVNTSSSKRQVGTGLGLWITKEIIEHMNGKIEMYSKPNKGTVVVIIIKSKFSLQLSRKQPLDSDQKEEFMLANEEEKDRVQPLRKEPTTCNMGLKSVLVVEDIPYNQEVNIKFLQKANVKEITVANNGLEAVDAFLKMGHGYFDLILMDIDMPIMDGKEATKIIRHEERVRGWIPVYIVFLTAYSESKTQQELLDEHGEYRANGFYSKPASLETVQRIIKGTISSLGSIPSLERTSSVNVLRDAASFVLIADDDSFNLTMMTKMLKLCGFNTLEARNGEEAVRLYKENFKAIKLILMDCEMPILNGLEATKQILAKQKHFEKFHYRKARIYGLTGHVGADHRQRCLEVGMEEVLEKPIKIETLRDILRKN